MARYTDIDKLIAEYDRVHVGSAGGARKLMVEAPIADVAPRKENDVPRYIKLPQPEYLPPTAEELEAFATKLYQSPIEIIMQEMQTQFDGEVFKATQAYGINVDKDELIKALQYDRDQYNKGFADGSRIDTTAIRAEVAREIFEEIEKYMMDSVDVTHTAYKTIGTSTFAILKKKYTEGQKCIHKPFCTLSACGAVCSSFKDKDRYADRNEVIREFAERLKADIVETGDEHGLGNSYPVLTHNYIDTLVKEMTGEAEP